MNLPLSTASFEEFVPKGCRLNDGRVDPEGRFVVSGTVEKGEEPLAAVYRNLEELSSGCQMILVEGPDPWVFPFLSW